jgi:hypothetical protein
MICNPFGKHSNVRYYLANYLIGSAYLTRGPMADTHADANAQLISMFRTNAGVVGGPFEGKLLVLLHPSVGAAARSE